MINPFQPSQQKYRNMTGEAIYNVLWGEGLTLHMRDPQLLHQPRRKHSTGKRSPKDRLKLGVQPADAHVLEFEVGGDDSGGRSSINDEHNPKRTSILFTTQSRPLWG